MDLVLHGGKWRPWKGSLKDRAYDSSLSINEIVSKETKNDNRLDPTHFKILVTRWFTEEFQKICDAKRSSRSKMKEPHVTGTKLFARLSHEEALKNNGVHPTRGELYIKTHTRKDGTIVDEKAAKVVNNPICLPQHRPPGKPRKYRQPCVGGMSAPPRLRAGLPPMFNAESIQNLFETVSRIHRSVEYPQPRQEVASEQPTIPCYVHTGFGSLEPLQDVIANSCAMPAYGLSSTSAVSTDINIGTQSSSSHASIDGFPAQVTRQPTVCRGRRKNDRDVGQGVTLTPTPQRRHPGRLPKFHAIPIQRVSKSDQHSHPTDMITYSIRDTQGSSKTHVSGQSDLFAFVYEGLGSTHRRLKGVPSCIHFHARCFEFELVAWNEALFSCLVIVQLLYVYSTTF